MYRNARITIFDGYDSDGSQVATKAFWVYEIQSAKERPPYHSYYVTRNARGIWRLSIIFREITKVFRAEVCPKIIYFRAKATLRVSIT